MNVPAVIRANAVATAKPAELIDVRDWLERLVLDWDAMSRSQRDSSQLPTVVQQLSSELAAARTPAGPKATAVLLDKLFTAVPMPGEEVLAVWIEFIEGFPADEIAAGVDAVIRSHRWPHPPLIADLLCKIRESDLHQERWRAGIALMRLRSRVKNADVTFQSCSDA
jgi:hypothetical protein